MTKGLRSVVLLFACTIASRARLMVAADTLIAHAIFTARTDSARFGCDDDGLLTICALNTGQPEGLALGYNQW